MKQSKWNILLILLLGISLAGNIALSARILQPTAQSSDVTLQEKPEAATDEDITSAQNTTASDTEETAYNTDYDFHSNAQYDERLSIFELNHSQADVIFAGDSITQKYLVNEFFPDVNLLNRGIGSDVSAGLLDRMDEILSHDPNKIFILIGINDIGKTISPDDTISNVSQCLQLCNDQNIQVYLISILPVVELEGQEYNDEVIALNQQYKALCDSQNVTYLDLYDSFLNEDGSVNADNYGPDGVHLNANGYTILSDFLSSYIYQ